MRSVYLLLILIPILCLAGCTSAKPGKSVDKNAGSALHLGVEGKVLNPDVMKKGGKLLILPFIPGENVFYDDEFERNTLMIVRGIADVFQKKKASFEFVFDKNVEETEFVIEGRILEKREVPGFKIVGPGKIGISFRGRMFNFETGETIAYFTYQRFVDENEYDFDQLSLMAGNELADFLLKK